MAKVDELQLENLKLRSANDMRKDNYRRKDYNRPDNKNVSSTMLPMTTPKSIFMTSETTEPVRKANHKNFKRLLSDLERMSANSRSIDRQSLLGPIKDVIELQLQSADEWDESCLHH